MRTLGAASLICLLGACTATMPVTVMNEDGRILQGSVTGSRTNGTFEVSDQTLKCEGAYDAGRNTRQMTLPVHCSDGKNGAAAVHRVENLRSGYGTATLADGEQYAFLYGKAINGLYATKMAYLRVWQSDATKAVEAGTMKRTDFWGEMYSRAAKAPEGPNDGPLMKFASNMLPEARRYEHGEIDFSQYQDFQLGQTADLRNALAAVADRQREINLRAQQLMIEQFAVTRPVMSSCSTSRGITNCIAY